MTIESFIDDFKEVYKGDPWSGISITKSLERIPWQDVNGKPETERKSIAEILLHIINWRIFVIAKIKENKPFTIRLNSQEDWTPIVINSDAEWEQLLERLEETQNIICSLLQGKSNYWFSEITAGKPYTNAYMMRGIIQHDMYHLGQINGLNTRIINSSNN